MQDGLQCSPANRTVATVSINWYISQSTLQYNLRVLKPSALHDVPLTGEDTIPWELWVGKIRVLYFYIQGSDVHAWSGICIVYDTIYPSLILSEKK